MARSSEKPTIEDIKAGLELKKARDEADVSQKMVAAHLGMTQQNYQKYEAGTQRMLKSVYDRTIAYCAGIILAKTGSSSTGFSEMEQDSYSAPVGKEIARQAIEDLKEAIRKLEKLVKG